jgi:hypothetical protein
MHAIASAPRSSPTLAADLERQRLEQRAARMRAVVRELRIRAGYHLNRHGEVPRPLRHAIGGFVVELRAIDRRIGELADRPTTSPRPASTRTRSS